MTILSIDHFVAARGAFRRRDAARLAAQLDRPTLVERSVDAGMTVEIEDPATPPLAFHLVYRDASNAHSARCVTLLNLLDEDADIRLTAFCHMRSARRMFMASRIVEATDLATGEVHTDCLIFFRDHPLLRSVGVTSAEDLAIRACRDEIIVLSVLAAADGEYDAEEAEQIVRHVMYRSDDPLDEDLVRQRIRAIVPDELAFDRSLDRICGGAGDASALVRSLRRVVDADGRLDPAEVAFVSDVQERLRMAGRC